MGEQSDRVVQSICTDRPRSLRSVFVKTVELRQIQHRFVAQQIIEP